VASGVVVANDTVVTVASAVAGHTTTTVDGFAAKVVVFDPSEDLAVLRVGGLGLPARALADAAPANSTPVNVVGYVNAHEQQGYPGVFISSLVVPSRGLYSRGIFLRRLDVVATRAGVAIDGGPVLAHGAVVGVELTPSSFSAHVGYAAPFTAVRSDLARASVAAVSTQGCVG
jgi:S1-C subfamily serine protease